MALPLLAGILLTAAGPSPALTFPTPPMLDFGNVPAGSFKDLTITGVDGNVAVIAVKIEVAPFASPGASAPGDFTVVVDHYSGRPGARSAVIRLTPSASGPRQARLRIRNVNFSDPFFPVDVNEYVPLKGLGGKQPSIPDLKQTDPRWANDVYDSATGANNRIKNKGCALTSVAMIIQSYGVTTGADGLEVNPGNLNNWLKANDGYDGRMVDWSKVGEYTNHQVEYMGKGTGTAADVQADIAAGQQSILWVNGRPAPWATSWLRPV